jgi:hypothetical protein
MGAYHCLHQRALSIPLFAPTGTQHTIVCADRCSAYHRSRRGALSIPMFMPAGAQRLIICANGRISLFALTGTQISLSRQWALIKILFTLTGAYHCPDSAFSPFPSIAPAIGHKIKVLHHQSLGTKSKHCATVWRYFSASRHCWVLFFSIAPPSGINSQHRTTIGLFFQASPHRLALITNIAPPSGAPFKHRAIIWRKFSASRHCGALFFSIAPLSGADYQHRIVLGRFFQASCRRLGPNLSITPFLGAGSNSQQCATIERFFHASCCHQALILNTVPPSSAHSQHLALSSTVPSITLVCAYSKHQSSCHSVLS